MTAIRFKSVFCPCMCGAAVRRKSVSALFPPVVESVLSPCSVCWKATENFDFTERLLFGIGFRPHRNLEILGKRKVGLRISPKRILAKGQALASMKPAFATLRLGKPEGAAKVEGAPPLRITPLRRTGWFKA